MNSALPDILHKHDVDVFFQPAYSCHLNTCEFCFRQTKCYLKQNPSLTTNETEIAISVAVLKRTAANSISYFRNCGYVWLIVLFCCYFKLTLENKMNFPLVLNSVNLLDLTEDKHVQHIANGCTQ